MLVAAIGAMATIGFDPVVSVVRFEYVTLGLALAGAFAVVYRLGAGLHGLGRRGLVVVAIGGVVLAVTLLYAELLRRYGSPDLVDNLLGRRALEPRPPRRLPAADRGRARRPGAGLGLSTCAPAAGRAGGCAPSASPRTTPVANALVNPAISLLECGLSVLYGLVVGLVIGYAVIRADLALTGSRGQGGRRLEEAERGPARASADRRAAVTPDGGYATG